ncbi:hypothetical protein [Xanthomonas maliensis]|uniref:hypothetical protein n=1 Tax=Xanthomonas maliensis TaxID=1321368 RepID=UPI0003A325CF|nr:hypothetical protein [Xanthomonas maliensis]
MDAGDVVCGDGTDTLAAIGDVSALDLKQLIAAHAAGLVGWMRAAQRQRGPRSIRRPEPYRS